MLNKGKLIFILFLLLPAAALIAKKNFRNIFESGEKKIRVINRIYKSYPAINKKIEIMKRLNKEWNSELSRFDQAPARKRAGILAQLNNTRKKFDYHLADLCNGLRVYSNDILADFTSRLKGSKKVPAKENYSNALQVTRQEFSRAEKAFTNRQYQYSAHLYDRGILILRKTYKKLGWGSPAIYSNL